MLKISYLKHSMLAIAVCAVTFFAIASGESAAEKEKKKEKILRLIKSEPHVKDAFTTDTDILYVIVIGEGTKWDGYAENLCQLLKDNQSDIERVKVVQLASQNDPNPDTKYGVEVGDSYCK